MTMTTQFEGDLSTGEVDGKHWVFMLHQGEQLQFAGPFPSARCANIAAGAVSIPVSEICREAARRFVCPGGSDDDVAAAGKAIFNADPTGGLAHVFELRTRLALEGWEGPR